MIDFRHIFKLNKLVILTGLFFMFNTLLISQTFELPPDSIIIQNKIKKITSYLHLDSSKSELSNIWIFDKKGRLISNQWFDDEDSTLNIELFYYKNSLLIEKWHIGTWIEYDTVKTKYTYNNENKVIKEVRTGSHIPFRRKSNQSFTNTITYTYLQNNTVIKKYEASNNYFRNSGIDSLIYNQKKELLFVFNKNFGSKISYKYNEMSQLTKTTLFLISDTNRVQHSVDFLYENEKLITELVKWTGLSYSSISKAIPEKIIYIYDLRNLYKKIIRENNFDTFEYEYH